MQITLEDLRELMAINGQLPDGHIQGKTEHPYQVDKNYIVRTVTMIYTGKLIEVWPQELVLVEAAWIPETERYMQFVEKGLVKECEPYPATKRVLIGRGGILDAVDLDAELPRSQR